MQQGLFIGDFKNLKNVQTLFLDLFKFILHEYDQLLDLGVVGFRSCGVDLASHFLSDETKFLARARIIVDRFQEVTAVLTKAYLFFIDVEFLDIEDHFLLEAALIRLSL